MLARLMIFMLKRILQEANFVTGAIAAKDLVTHDLLSELMFCLKKPRLPNKLDCLMEVGVVRSSCIFLAFFMPSFGIFSWS